MAIFFADSYDHYAVADTGLKYSATGGLPYASISTASGRNGTSGIRSSSIDGLVLVTPALGNQPALAAGIAFRTSAIGGSESILLAFLDAGSVQTDLRLTTAAELSVHVTDPDGDALSVLWTVNGQTIQTNAVPPSKVSISEDVFLSVDLPLSSRARCVNCG